MPVHIDPIVVSDHAGRHPNCQPARPRLRRIVGRGVLLTRNSSRHKKQNQYDGTKHQNIGLASPFRIAVVCRRMIPRIILLSSNSSMSTCGESHTQMQDAVKGKTLTPRYQPHAPLRSASGGDWPPSKRSVQSQLCSLTVFFPVCFGRQHYARRAGNRIETPGSPTARIEI
jgi:hypothetical protein